MPLYINDAEVSQLADELAAKSGSSKTDLIRRLLREESARLKRLQTADERLRQILEISKRGAEIARRGNFSYTKKDADAMFEYLESEAKAVVRRKRRAS